MRTFVTGGAGFIGSHSVAALLQAGHEVVVWDDLSTGKLANLGGVIDQITLFEGDVRDFDALQRAIDESRPDGVLHLAAIASVPRSIEEPLLAHAVNVTGTVNVLEASRRAGIGRVVLASSAAIYGDEPTVPKTESMRAYPSSPYGLQKWQSEQYAELYSTLFGLTTVALRYFNVFGPRQDPKSPYSGVISIFLNCLLDAEQPVIYGDGEQTRDFIYVADVAEANLRALTRPLTGHHGLNIACGQETSIKQLHGLLCAILCRRPDPVFRPRRRGDIARSCADPNQAEATLGFRARHTLAEGLERLVVWSRVPVELAAAESSSIEVPSQRRGCRSGQP